MNLGKLIFLVVGLSANAGPMGIEKDAQPLTKSDKSALNALMDNSSTKCKFMVLYTWLDKKPRLYPDNSEISRLPTMNALEKTCADGRKEKAFYCRSDIECESKFQNFFVRQAVCWSSDGYTCPDAKTCAKQSFLNSVVDLGNLNNLVEFKRDPAHPSNMFMNDGKDSVK